MTLNQRVAAACLIVLVTACERSAPDSAAIVEDVQSGQPNATASGHEHAEESLGTVTIGDLEVDLAQGHGAVAAGKEGHLVVKLPYSDQGRSIVRAWIGTEDRTQSYVGKGTYAASHDDYDIHASAPDPLPATARWWVEIEGTDGARVVGSALPLFE